MRGPKMRVLLVLGLLVLFAVDYVAAQSLPPCALDCVGKTKTKCKSTDYVCACSDGKYLPRLTQCIDKKCDDASRPQAHSYLASLCLAVGYPILDHGDAGAVLELRELAQVPAERVAIIEKRQNATFISSLPTRTRSSSGLGPTNSTTSTRTSNTSSPTGDSDNNGIGGGGGGGGSSSSSGGIKKGAKIGIGVAIPLVLGVLAFLVVLFKKHQAKKAGTANPTDPTLPPYAPGADPSKQPYMVGPTGPAELPQDAQYIGHEMPTQHNAAEMPAAVPPPGTVQPYGSPIQGQPQQAQVQQVQPQQVQPQPGQPQPVQPPTGFAQPAPVPYPQPGQVPYFPPGSPQYTQTTPVQYPAPADATNPQPGQVYYPPPGQPQNPTADPQHYPPPGQQWPGQQQQQAPAELPERMKSPQ